MAPRDEYFFFKVRARATSKFLLDLGSKNMFQKSSGIKVVIANSLSECETMICNFY